MSLSRPVHDLYPARVRTVLHVRRGSTRRVLKRLRLDRDAFRTTAHRRREHFGSGGLGRGADHFSLRRPDRLPGFPCPRRDLLTGSERQSADLTSPGASSRQVAADRDSASDIAARVEIEERLTEPVGTRLVAEVRVQIELPLQTISCGGVHVV